MSQDLANESDRDQRLSEVLLAYVEAAEAGRPPDREQLLAAHPDLRAELEEFFASHDAVEQLAAPLREAASEGPGTPVRPRGQKASAGAPAELGQLGDYRLLREVGRGGMGVVYEAEQISLRRRVALKVLPFAAAIDPRQLQRFQNEALAAAHLRHENIVPVYAVGNERGVHYYAMQLIAGQSLAALISGLRRMAAGPGAEQPAAPSRRGPAAETTGPYLYSGGEEETELGDAERLAAESISRERSSGGRRYFNWVAGLGRQAALALEHAHQLGIVHRDIKPANLLLDPRGQLWVTDFGLALVSNDAGLTVTGELLGTLRYASPEQALARRGLVDHRSDIYSLGATLYELLTLRPIFDGRDRHELLRQIADEEPVPPRTVDRTIPVELETIVLKALAKEPGDRYATAQELADDLQRFVEDQPIRARRPSLMERATKWARRHRSWVASAVAALLLSVAGLSAATAVTARAYERERVKSREAEEGFRQAGLKARESEESFRQAREAVDAFEKIAEEELAGQPHLQGVRRRLLEVALSYYQNFIDQRHDDPRIQAELEATRTRVGQIVAELTTLMGAGDYRLLREKDVQQDLGLSGGQKQELVRLDQRFEGRRHQVFHGYGKVSPEVGERRLLAVAQEQERAVANVLSRDQLRRFKQIVLWDRGAQAFSDPEVARALRLTAEQKKRIRDVQDQTNLALVRCGPYGGDRREPARNPEEVRKDAEQKILALLTPAQKTKWEELAGKPFHRKHQFNQRPWQGPGGPPGEPGRGPGRPGKGPRPPR